MLVIVLILIIFFTFVLYYQVTRVRFSDYGNKFAAADADGNLAMWQLHPAPQPHGQPQASPRPYFVSTSYNEVRT